MWKTFVIRDFGRQDIGSDLVFINHEPFSTMCSHTKLSTHVPTPSMPPSMILLSGRPKVFAVMDVTKNKSILFSYKLV
jgi:hypothetical protein